MTTSPLAEQPQNGHIENPHPLAWLAQGDALVILPRLRTGIVDMVLTDPPYSSGGAYRGDRAQATPEKYQNSNTAGILPAFPGDGRDQRSYTAWFITWATECYRITKAGGIFATFTDWRQLAAVIDAVQVAGFVLRGVLPWCKPAGRPVKGRFRNTTEFIVWATAGAFDGHSEECLPGHFHLASVANQSRVHATQKPTELLSDLLRILGDREATVLDPFAGTGSTGVAAIASGYRFIGVELDPHWLDVTRRRIADAPRLLMQDAEPTAAGTLFDGIALAGALG